MASCLELKLGGGVLPPPFIPARFDLSRYFPPGIVGGYKLLICAVFSNAIRTQNIPIADPAHQIRISIL
jgi:hypothetical protein